MTTGRINNIFSDTNRVVTCLEPINEHFGCEDHACCAKKGRHPFCPSIKWEPRGLVQENETREHDALGPAVASRKAASVHSSYPQRSVGLATWQTQDAWVYLSTVSVRHKRKRELFVHCCGEKMQVGSHFVFQRRIARWRRGSRSFAASYASPHPSSVTCPYSARTMREPPLSSGNFNASSSANSMFPRSMAI